MRIRRLELFGFKSFADRTTLHLAPGICAVVGPNGCGKSNVVDAVRWTLGEQSPGTLRGRGMEDVIFAGSEGRSPSGLAEVHLVFDNADGAFGGDYAHCAEVEVGRRLGRGGRSDYLVNRTPARLKDVVRLFLDTGVGARAYSIIEQGRVGFIVNARPEQRRVLIDEVAGINRFKDQRAEAERRLAATKDNLDRVADLAGELGRQRKALETQAELARRFRELRRAWRRASLEVVLGAAAERRAALRTARDAQVEAAAEEARARAALDELEQARTAARQKAAEARLRLDALRERRAAAQADQRLAEREAGIREEERAASAERARGLRAELAEAGEEAAAAEAEAARVARVLAEARAESERTAEKLRPAAAEEERLRDAGKRAAEVVEEAKARSIERLTAGARAENLEGMLGRRVEEARAALAGHRSEVERAAEGMAEHRARAGSAQERVEVAVAARREADEAAATRRREAEEAASARDAAAESLAEAERRLHRVQAESAGLRALAESREGYGDAVREAFERLGPEELPLGTVAELLAVEEGDEALVSRALGELAEALVVRDVEACGRLLRALGVAPPPGLRLVVLEPPADGPEGLSGLARDEARAVGLSRLLLGPIVFSEDAGVERIPALRAEGRPEALLSGPLRIDRLGLRVPGSAESGAALLARARRLAALGEEEAALERARAERAVEAAVASGAEEAAREAATAARSAAHRAELAELGARRDRDEANRELRRAEEAARLAEEAGTRLAARVEAAEAEAAGAAQEAELARAAVAAAEARLEEARRAADRAAEATRAHASTVHGLRVESARAEAVVSGHRRDLERMQERARDFQRRRERAERDADRAEERGRVLVAEVARLKERAARAALDSDGLARAVEDASAEEVEASGTLAAIEERVRTARSRLEAARRAVSGQDVGVAEARAGLQAHRAALARDFDLELDPLLDELERHRELRIPLPSGGEPLRFELDALLAAGAVQRAQRDSVRLHERIDALGPVNLQAGEEFAEADRRFKELEERREDLHQAVRDLRTAVRRIEGETRRRFAEAFEAVAARFAEGYPRLVGGGRAELRLTDPDDLLGSGVEVVVEPPGKRLQALSLLSGGEKAMAAIALVFAIFRVKPSPFCILDEVDAPLDEANSRRFNAMLRELSAETQFVVITHNRTTMEVADVLYGVTMQAAGVSSLVAVSLDRAVEVAAAPADRPARPADALL